MKRKFPLKKIKQQGAALFIALIVLLVITLLALSSVREVTMESRITGNFVEQRQLLNAAEAALREGEGGMTSPLKPLDATTTCSSDAVCLLKDTPNYTQLFDADNKSVAYGVSDGTQPNSNIELKWYALTAPSGAAEGASENPEYGNMMQGIGTFRYEVNTQARNTQTNSITKLRSTTAKVFN
ncbi:pilus assembly PilX family protein [Pseudomonas kuykendallii]|uniref:Pilus assembly protein PilX n=1 Tax=Pseudomonas kuykendallii TaxID=1007099 RepID=A0A2W5ETC6_9PSED|nr:PilX N-terminal domain-containing pilus assembly protein [Pseudomonas kuykendallii]PZP23336.1 MAG: pilus assembly protein PilX [Pseudomonas kuykendallii]